MKVMEMEKKYMRQGLRGCDMAVAFRLIGSIVKHTKECKDRLKRRCISL